MREATGAGSLDTATMVTTDAGSLDTATMVTRGAVSLDTTTKFVHQESIIRGGVMTMWSRL